MRLQRIQIKNFRCFDDFDLTVGGDSVTVVAPNAGGKTTLLVAIGSALSGARGFGRRDFRDLDEPLEIVATLKEFDPDDQGAFADAIRFSGPEPTLEIGIRAIWDDDAEQVDITWGFPQRAWARAGREARERLALLWLPSARDPTRLISFVGTRSVLDQLVSSLDLDDPLSAALTAVQAATDGLITSPAMSQLLEGLRDALAQLIPDVATGAFNIETVASTSGELLGQFELALAHAGPHVPVERQSSGLVQLAIFVVALQLAVTRPYIVLLDEPEASLHPQAQRSLATAIRRDSHQSIVATHSSNVLSGGDARNVVRLQRDGADVEAKRPSSLSADDAAKLVRYTTPETAEAFFARTVVLVEGPSDYLAVRAAARAINMDLDARGVAVVSLQGAGLLATYLSLLGPSGLDLRVCGLCDADTEGDWQAKLTAAGMNASDRASMNAHGFFVCDVDLEDELVRALGDAAVQEIIEQEGETAKFTAFANQPSNRTMSLNEQLVAFARSNKTRWSPRLAADLGAASMPEPLQGVFSRV